MASVDAGAGGDGPVVVDSSVSSSAAVQSAGSPAPALASATEDVDQPPAVEMKDVDEAIGDASGEGCGDPEGSSSKDDLSRDGGGGGGGGGAPLPALSSPASDPTPPQPQVPSPNAAPAPPLSPPPPPPQPQYDLPHLISSAVASADFSQLLTKLEEIELETADVAPPADVLGCMIATNLILNDVVNAKLLWKRIPSRVKSDNPELEFLWKIGTKLWVSDYHAVFAEIKRPNWSPLLQPLITCLAESVRQRVIALIEKSYESLRLSSLSTLLGLEDEESQMSLAVQRQWRVSQGFAFPVKSTATSSTTTTRTRTEDDDALRRLTDYVAFLEE